MARKGESERVRKLQEHSAQRTLDFKKMQDTLMEDLETK